jgi:hypothetical protein
LLKVSKQCQLEHRAKLRRPRSRSRAVKLTCFQKNFQHSSNQKILL